MRNLIFCKWSGTGIGAATARRLAAEGAAVAVIGRRPEPLRLVAGGIGDRALRDAMHAAGRDLTSLELVGGTRAIFPDSRRPADLGQALSAVQPQLDAGFSTFCITPSQFTDDPADVPASAARSSAASAGSLDEPHAGG